MLITDLTQQDNLLSLIEYSIANVPLGRYHLTGVASRPFGLAVLALPEEEGTLHGYTTFKLPPPHSVYE